MLKLENIPPEQMPDVVKIATELQERDRRRAEETQHQQSTIAAAEEVGLPETYLHQAANELHTRRVVQIEQRRQRRTGLVAIGAAVMLGSGIYLFSSLAVSRQIAPQIAPPQLAAPAIVAPAQMKQPFNATQWRLNSNQGTQANVTYENGVAKVSIQKFTQDASGRYFANLNTKSGVQNLSGYSTATFRAAGTLPYVRLYLENGKERWRSPALSVSSNEQLLRVNFNNLERQEIGADGISWTKARFQMPTTVERFSIKFGAFVNDANATGTVNLSDLQFE